jgi:CoA:oxalate CoA-transferase
VAAASDADFRGLLKIFGRWDLENDWRFLFDRITDDVDKLKVLEVEFKKELIKFARKDLVRKTLSYSASAAKSKLRGKGFPIIVETLSPREVLQEEHWKIRNSFLDADPGMKGGLKIPSSVPKMSESPPRTKRLECGIGQDNDKIYEKYGLMK